MTTIKITNVQIAQAMTNAGFPITPAAVGQYRAGKLKNPETAIRIRQTEIQLKKKALDGFRAELGQIVREVGLH